MKHSDLSLDENHTPFFRLYANSSSREAETGFTASHVGKQAWQTNDDSIWLLKNYNPITWVRLGGSGILSEEAIVLSQGSVSISGTTVLSVFKKDDGAGLIPAATLASYPLTSIGTPYSNFRPINCFDNNISSYWEVLGSVGGISIQFPESTVLNKYDVQVIQDNLSWAPRNWTFDGSNNGTTWTTLDTQTAQTFTNDIRSFEIGNTTPYIYYRIYVTAINGGPAIGICTINLYKRIDIATYILLRPVTDYLCTKIGNDLTVTNLTGNSKTFLVHYI